MKHQISVRYGLAVIRPVATPLTACAVEPDARSDFVREVDALVDAAVESLLFIAEGVAGILREVLERNR